MHVFSFLRTAGLTGAVAAIAALPAAAQSAKATLKTADGKDVGTAQLTQAATGGVLITLAVMITPSMFTLSESASRHSRRREVISIRTTRSTA